MSQMHNPCHPGEILKEALSKISVTDAAKRLGVGRVALSRLLNGATGISPERAVGTGLSRNDRTAGHNSRALHSASFVGVVDSNVRDSA